jgi:squalene-hopene/tetraprenyl-beta-curcumene cyclase
VHLGIQSLLLEGYGLDSDVIQRGMQAIERFLWQDADGKRLQSCVSPVWDTILMVQGLCDAGVDRQDERLETAVNWFRQRQILGPEGDWRIYSPDVTPGGFGFEYHNTWYPDIDDTVAAILSMVRHNPTAVTSEPVTAAISWVLGMQNKDGGWAGFDKDNNQTWLNKLPVADLNNLSDPSSPDCAGHVIEAFGLIMRTARRKGLHLNPWLEIQMTVACDRAINYLVRTQESTGAWYGRWAVNYVFGTSNVLGGLAYFEDDVRVRTMQQPATRWLKKMRNADGGWGESLLSYRDPLEHAGRGPSTPSQTSWALMGLLTTCAPDDEDILAGVSYLLQTQTDVRGDGAAASWPERQYTGTGFPNHFYIGYSLYRHYFPLMALGRFVSASDLESEKCRSNERAPL